METISCHTVMTHAVSSGEHREKLNYTWKRQSLRDILFLDFLQFSPSVCESLPPMRTPTI